MPPSAGPEKDAVTPSCFKGESCPKANSDNEKTSDCVSLCSEHSMAETLSVALRVAEETIDEAISKAEFNSASQVIDVARLRNSIIIVSNT